MATRPPETERRPSEDWGEWVKRLEAEHLRAIGRHKEKEAEALESVPEPDTETRTTAKAKRAAAEEFFKAVEKMERGGR